LRIAVQFSGGHAIHRVSKFVRHSFVELIAIFQVKLPEFNKDGTAFIRARRVRCCRRIAHVSPLWKVAMLILKNTIQHDKLFPTGMGVGLKFAFWRISHNRRGARHFAANAV